ncbi:TAT (twin-arginine translocation) pathway-exported protein [Larkinella arboricola]|uniref:TAT (Twin-arginine translocation) pathway-exported protein n=1 Tax=Larkinella arboricola TaxID=643671 RepID=A0A327X777_LARAB|nr:metallophosphoesterase [Larkinella arboricola]RAK01924.1 TAT (twin-arginine translocation) pathway-exported protein [Larkinella arboricola]
MNNPKQSTDRRSFLKSAAGLGATGALGSVVPASVLARNPSLQSPDPAKGHVFLSEPYLQYTGPGSMTVMWIANLPSYSWVEYGENESLGKKAHSVTDGLIDAYNRINKITLNGLKPGTTYQYRVYSKEITEFKPYKLTYGTTIDSGLLSFTTPNEQADTVSCLVLNDVHDRPDTITHLLSLKGNDPFDFVFLNGDLFDYQTNEQQLIDHLLVPCSAGFAREKPFLFVRGNHETRGKYRGEIHQYFTNPQNKHYYSYTWGPVHFTVIDTGEDKPDTEPVYAGIVDFDAYREEQARWVDQVMQSTAYKKAKFRVVFMHIPTHHHNNWHGPMHCQKLFTPLFNKHKVDLCISGHTHRYGVHEPVAGQHNYPIIIGGGSRDGSRTLIKLKADRKDLNLSMLLDDGKEVGRYHLTAKR